MNKGEIIDKAVEFIKEKKNTRPEKLIGLSTKYSHMIPDDDLMAFIEMVIVLQASDRKDLQ